MILLPYIELKLFKVMYKYDIFTHDKMKINV